MVHYRMDTDVGGESCPIVALSWMQFVHPVHAHLAMRTRFDFREPTTCYHCKLRCTLVNIVII